MIRVRYARKEIVVDSADEEAGFNCEKCEKCEGSFRAERIRWVILNGSFGTLDSARLTDFKAQSGRGIENPAVSRKGSGLCNLREGVGALRCSQHIQTHRHKSCKRPARSAPSVRSVQRAFRAVPQIEIDLSASYTLQSNHKIGHLQRSRNRLGS